jgi:bifunctional non-homologous end joining protein LigD
MIAKIRRGKVALYSRNGKIISRSYMEFAKALEGVKGDAVIDGELVAIGKDGVSHFQLLQNALRHEAKLLYCAFDLMFENAVDLRKQPLLERKKRLKAILPRDKLVAFALIAKEMVPNSLPKQSGGVWKASWRSAPTARIRPEAAPRIG